MQDHHQCSQCQTTLEALRGNQRTTTVGPTEPASSMLFLGGMSRASHPVAATPSSQPPPTIMGMFLTSPGGPSFPASGRNPTMDLINSYARINRQRQEGSARRAESRPRWPQTAHGTWIATIETTETPQVEIGRSTQQKPEPAPELCCICMGEAASHTLEPCNHSSFCGTCAMLFTAGAVSGPP